VLDLGGEGAVRFGVFGRGLINVNRAFVRSEGGKMKFEPVEQETFSVY